MADNQNPKKSDQKKWLTSQQPSGDPLLINRGLSFTPGIIRVRDAPYYLGMNKTYFRDQVQPYLTRIRIDKKGIGFTRTELDQWIAYAQATLSQPPRQTPPWENQDHASAHPIRSLPITQPSKPPRKTRVKKRVLPGKPTSQDLACLVGKIISEETHRQKVKS
jgi:hypothetical protein